MIRGVLLEHAQFNPRRQSLEGCRTLNSADLRDETRDSPLVWSRIVSYVDELNVFGVWYLALKIVQ